MRPRVALSGRVRQIRLERFGEDGIPLLARSLGISARNWRRYEAGVRIPGDVILRFIVLTGVEPQWLLRGEGPKYSASSGSPE